MLAPSPSQPDRRPFHGLWSLLDMLRPYAAQFVFLAELITELKQFTPRYEGNATTLAALMQPSELDRKVRSYWPGLKHLTEAIPLPAVVPHMERISRTLDGMHSQEELIALMAELKNRLEDDLERQLFFHVKAERAPYYDNPTPFGIEVSAAYPTARDDIEAAGKCLALEQGTAAVFHLMGVMEIGLRSLGHALGIPYAPSWESYIRQITTNMGVEHKKKPDDWKENEDFYRDLLGDLVAVKNAWRNPTIHVKRKYLPDEAEEVFRAARTFMKRASTKLSGRPSDDVGEVPPS